MYIIIIIKSTCSVKKKKGEGRWLFTPSQPWPLHQGKLKMTPPLKDCTNSQWHYFVIDMNYPPIFNADLPRALVVHLQHPQPTVPHQFCCNRRPTQSETKLHLLHSIPDNTIWNEAASYSMPIFIYIRTLCYQEHSCFCRLFLQVMLCMKPVLSKIKFYIHCSWAYSKHTDLRSHTCRRRSVPLDARIVSLWGDHWTCDATN